MSHSIIILLFKNNVSHLFASKYYLVDNSYYTRKGFIYPYRAIKYYLNDFTSIRPTNAKKLFNLRHSSLCTTVESAFGSLKNRFRIIKCYSYFPLQTQVDVILVFVYYIIGSFKRGDNFIFTEDEWVRRVSISRHDMRVIDNFGAWLDKRERMTNAT